MATENPQTAMLIAFARLTIFYTALLVGSSAAWRLLRNPSLIHLQSFLFGGVCAVQLVSYLSCVKGTNRSVWPLALATFSVLAGLILMTSGIGYYVSPEFYSGTMNELNLQSLPPRTMMAICTCATGLTILLWGLYFRFPLAIIRAAMYPAFIVGLAVPFLQSFSSKTPLQSVISVFAWFCIAMLFTRRLQQKRKA